MSAESVVLDIDFKLPREAMRVGREMRRHSAVILYVEDNTLLARPVADALELAGWKVYHFSESGGATTALDGETHFDLLLLDQDLPHRSGVELTRRARGLAHRRETPIIVCSIENVAEEARRAGANQFLRKPAHMIRIVDVVRRLLRK
ncbi:MAG TPA: response regulator [Pyrinomonadaceae bacterium]|jgi:DNA-binding response OmpR family regulator